MNKDQNYHEVEVVASGHEVQIACHSSKDHQHPDKPPATIRITNTLTKMSERHTVNYCPLCGENLSKDNITWVNDEVLD